MKYQLSGLTVKEVCLSLIGYVEDKDMNLGDEPHDPEEVESYVLPERLIEILDPQFTLLDNDKFDVELTSEEACCFSDELDTRIDIAGANYDYFKTGRGADAKAEAEFAKMLRLMRADRKQFPSRCGRG